MLKIQRKKNIYTKLITQKEFSKKKLNSWKYASSYVEIDTAYIGKLHYRLETKKISIEDRNLLVSYLNKVAGVKVGANKNILINYFKKPRNFDQSEKIKSRNRGYLNHYISNKKYKKQRKRSKNTNHFFITEKGFDGENSEAFIDEENLMRKLFFKYNNEGYVIVRPNGDFLIDRGEYHAEKHTRNINADWNKIVNSRGVEPWQCSIPGEVGSATHSGVLNKSEYTELVGLLDSELKTTFPRNKSILINFISKPEASQYSEAECGNNETHKRTIEKVRSLVSEKSDDITNFFVYTENSDFKQLDKVGTQSVLDSGFFNKYIFTEHKFCLSFLLIKPNGTFYKHFGDKHFLSLKKSLKDKGKKH